MDSGIPVASDEFLQTSRSHLAVQHDFIVGFTPSSPPHTARTRSMNHGWVVHTPYPRWTPRRRCSRFKVDIRTSMSCSETSADKSPFGLDLNRFACPSEGAAVTVSMQTSCNKLDEPDWQSFRGCWQLGCMIWNRDGRGRREVSELSGTPHASSCESVTTPGHREDTSQFTHECMTFHVILSSDLL